MSNSNRDERKESELGSQVADDATAGSAMHSDAKDSQPHSEGVSEPANSRDDGDTATVSADAPSDPYEERILGSDADETAVEDGGDVLQDEAANEDAGSVDSEEGEEDGAEEEGDAYLSYITAEYQKYRIRTLVLAIIGFSIVLLAIGLSQTGVVDLKIFNLMMSVANLFIVIMLVTAFTRTRPFRKKVRSYDKYYVSITDPDAKDGVRIEERSLPDMDDFFRIFERQARTELIPETDEYKRLRRTWLGIFIAAGIALVVSVALYLLVPAASTIAVFILLAAMILVAIAFYFDRTKMRPIRTKWSRDNYGLAEFQVRDRMGKR